MRDFSSAERPPLRRHLKVVVIFLIALVAVSVMGKRGLLRLYQMHREKAALTREIDQLSSANLALAEEVRQLKTDPSKIEEIAREELGLVKPGELVFEFQAAPGPQAPPAAR